MPKRTRASAAESQPEEATAEVAPSEPVMLVVRATAATVRESGETCALWDRNERYPGGEVFITRSAGQFTLPETPRLREAIDGGRVEVIATITHEGDWYVAHGRQVEVTSQGETVEAAAVNLREALALYEQEP